MKVLLTGAIGFICLNSIFVPKLSRILQKYKSSYFYKMFHIKL